MAKIALLCTMSILHAYQVKVWAHHSLHRDLPCPVHHVDPTTGVDCHVDPTIVVDFMWTLPQEWTVMWTLPQ